MMKKPQFTDFVTFVNEKIELEKYIAITTNKLLSFNKKWSNFLKNKLLEASWANANTVTIHL